MDKNITLPKMPRGQGSFFIHNERNKIGYRKNFTLPNGRKIKKTVYGDTIDECLLKMKNVEKDIDNNVNITKQLLYEAMVNWAEIAKKPTLKIQSYERLMQIINNQIKQSSLGNMSYQKITSDDIQEFINSVNDDGYSYSVIKKCYYALKAFFDYTCLRDNVPNPMLLVVMPKKINVYKEDKEIVWFEKDDIDKFISECQRLNKYSNAYKYKHGLMYAANIYLGLRIGELLALQWKDINFEKNTIAVTKTMIYKENPKHKKGDKSEPRFIATLQKSNKTNQNRYVPMNSKAKELILKYRETFDTIKQNDYVMSTKNNTIVDVRAANYTIKTIQKNAHTFVQNASSHTLRHTCASLYFRKGVRIEIIAKILGHTPEVCRRVYIGLVEEQLQEAASLLVPVIEI